MVVISGPTIMDSLVVMHPGVATFRGRALKVIGVDLFIRLFRASRVQVGPNLIMLAMVVPHVDKEI